MDTTRIGYIANMMLRLKKPVMLVGNAGSAKTVLLGGLLKDLDEDAWLFYNINFNSMTEAVDTQVSPTPTPNPGPNPTPYPTPIPQP